jgi:hypothetical protein
LRADLPVRLTMGTGYALQPVCAAQPLRPESEQRQNKNIIHWNASYERSSWGMKPNTTDRHHRIKQIVAGIALALIIAGICIPAGVCAGERKIRGEWILPENYPDGFDGYGYINRIAADEVVIDEALHRVSPAIIYATPNNIMAKMGDFTEGDLVGYLTNSEQVIVSLWLIEKARR